MQKLFFLVSILWGFLLHAQQIEVKGKILSNNQAVPYAQIILHGTNLATLCDTSGYFTISVPSQEVYTFKISAVGYFNKQISLKKENLSQMLIISLKENDNVMDEVVVTGTAREHHRTETITPVEVYTPKFLQKNPSPNLFYALQNINGVQPQLQCAVCNTGDIHINGMEGPYTLILIDGMPIVSSLSTVYGLMGIPNVMVERIEIIKGPASTLYGSEAVAGIINIITKNPAKANKLFADYMLTSYRESNVDLMGKAKIGTSPMVIGANVYHYNHIVDVNKDNFTDVTLQKRISLFSKIDFKRKDERKAMLGARVFYEDRWGGETTWSKTYRGSNIKYGESIYTKRLELIGAYQLPIAKENLMLNFSYNLHDQNSAYGITSFVANQHTSFIQLIHNKQLGARHNLSTGSTLRHTAYIDNTAATRSLSDSTQHAYTITILPGLFTQLESSLHEKHKILAGIRYDHHNIHGNIFSPRVGYKANFSKTSFLRLNIGNGFRVVNVFTEDHASITGSRTVVISEKLKPEQSWNGNLTFTKFVNFNKGFLNLEYQAFYTYFTNKLVPDYDTDPNKIIYANLKGHAISKGMAINIDAALSNGLKATLGATYMRVYRQENNIKQTQIHSPIAQGTFTISYTIPKIKIAVDYTGVMYGPQRLPIVANDFRPEYAPWFTLQNMQLTREWKKYTIYGGIKNIFNFLPQNPLFNPQQPFSDTFDTSYNYAPMQARRVFIGFRVNIK